MRRGLCSNWVEGNLKPLQGSNLYVPMQAWITLLLLVAMFVLMAWDKLPTWVVFLGAMTVAMTLQLPPPAGPLKGFSNAGVLTVAALLPVAAEMYSTGAISLPSQRLIGQPKTETRPSASSESSNFFGSL